MVDADGLLAQWVQEWPESGSVLAGASVLAGQRKAPELLPFALGASRGPLMARRQVDG